MPEVLAIAYRGELEESRHYGSVAVVDKAGKLLFSRGNPERFTFLRSAAKPFQVLPLFDTGAYEKYGFTRDEIAVMCGSHSGENMHVQRVNSILGKVGLTESDLQCGIHPPFHRPTAESLLKSGEKIGPIRNTCSGKHACMLAITRFREYDLNTYMELNHPTQQLMLQAVAHMTEFPAEFIGTGLDTCGVPVFAVPLRHMAQGYANLASPQKYSGSRRRGIEEIQRAMVEYPELVAGTKRFTTDLLKVLGSKIIAKDGAESVFGIGIVPYGIGIAIKIEDGSERALAAVVMEVLKELHILDKDLLDPLSRYTTRTIKTWSGVVAGKIAPVRLF